MKLRIPTRFLIDHEERALPTPAYELRGGAAWIDPNDPALLCSWRLELGGK